MKARTPAPTGAGTSAVDLQTSVFLTRKQAAALLCVSQQLISKLIKNQQLPAYRLGRAVRIKVSDLEATMQLYVPTKQCESPSPCKTRLQTCTPGRMQ